MRALRRTALAAACAVLASSPVLGAQSPTAPAGTASRAPCAPPNAPDPMPEGAGHDHADESQHRFACRLDLVAARDLRAEVPEPMQFGEVDVAGNVAVMATTFPEAGFLVFDVTDPGNPVFRSRFRSTPCEKETDLDCGADVKLHPSGRLAFLALQRSRITQRPAGKRIPTGIAVVDLSDPAKPRQASFLSLPPSGVHLLAHHVIGGREYVVARIRVEGRGALPIADDADPRGGSGFGVYRLDGTTLTRVVDVRTRDSHDVSLYDDPSDGRTYLAVSGGRSSSLFLYDLTDPARPRALGSWAPEPDDTGEGWYIHDTTIFRHGSRRFAVVGAEHFKAEPFHGGSAGTVWMLDLADLAKPHLIGQWSNPGGHASGELTLSTHTSFYSDGFTWTAHYHGGVWLLDWRAVLAGRAQRATEAGYYVPHTVRRPFVVNKVDKPFITGPPFQARPLIWDVVFAKGHAFVSDITGGLVVLARERSGKSPAATPSRSGGVGAPAVLAGALVVGAASLVVARRRRSRPAG